MGFLNLFSGKTVRKNVNLDADLADKLERLSVVSGMSQGDVLNLALAQPFMRRLMYFVSDDVESPVAEVMDQYQAGGPGVMSRDTSGKLVKLLLDKILPMSMFPGNPDGTGDPRGLGPLNDYFAMRVRDARVDDLSVLQECRDLAVKNEFFTYDYKASSANVGKFVRGMHVNMDDPRVYAGDLLFRCLVVTFRDFCPNMAFDTRAEAMAYQYKACAEVLADMFPRPGGPWPGI